MAKRNPLRFLILSLALAACAKKSDDTAQPVVTDIKQTRIENAVEPGRAEGTATVPGKRAGALVSEVTLSKAALLGRTFSYSSSLQFSSIVDGDISAAMMGLSLGEVPASFQILDEKLRLLTDGSINFESDVNHPSRLVFEFPILRQDEGSVTIRVDRPSPIMDTFLFGNKNKVPVRYSFVRSMEAAEEGSLIMIESTVELVDGSIGEFLESIRPREATVPADVKAIYADSELNPAADRYRFLSAGDVYVPKKERERVKTKAAARFLIRDGQPIKWYVTPNIPDTYLEDVKNAVEGWNRYSSAAKMGYDLVKFEGRLPEGVKVGDPRYNLIIWDTVQEAGAAYESQNSDPATGVQSHSMIYIPYAWVNIGKDYFNKLNPGAVPAGEARAATLQKLLRSRSFLGRSLPVSCMDSPELHLALEASEAPEQFARALLKGVVFHEMGHALGLAHNFKGSLSFDADDPAKLFSTSIMDYNHYNEEVAAFADLESSDGPLLEYDRQIISVLYNGGKDVQAGDEEIPACDDEEADSTDKGIDPLCNRYDIGSDVTREALRALQLSSNPGLRHGRMDSISARKVLNSLTGLPPAAEVKTKGDLAKTITKAQAKVSGMVGIYLAASANSFGYLGSQAVRSLKVFQEDALPSGYVESEMRDRALTALEKAASMEEFPALTKEAVAAAKPALLEYTRTSAYVAALSPEEQDQALADTEKLVDKQVIQSSEATLLSKMRIRFISALASTPNAPLAFHERGGQRIDLELVVMGLLEKLSSGKAGPYDRPAAERSAALKSLKTYSRSESFEAASQRVITALRTEIQGSTDALKKEDARKLLADFMKTEGAKSAE